MEKTYNEINDKIAAGKAVVLTAEEIIDYVDKHGEEKALKDIDVVTTATFGPMCSSGCFLNFGQCNPKIRITECTLDGVMAYSGVAGVDAYLGATQLRDNAPANLNFPGDFSFGGGYVIEKLIARKKVELIAKSYGTQEYPRRELRTIITIDDLNQAVMVNPRNCYQNYNVAINCSDERIYTYLGQLEPHMKNATYCSAAQLSPLLNDPLYETTGIGTSVWLAGSHGHVHYQGTQHCPTCERTSNDVPIGGAGTLGLTADMKQMNARYVRGCSFKGYGVSLTLGIGIPIPLLNMRILRHTCVRDCDIKANIIDYSHDYPTNNGKVWGTTDYASLKSGEITVNGCTIQTSSLSSYFMAQEIAQILKAEIADGKFQISAPVELLPRKQTMKGLPLR
ncbi:MAG: homocysteine biosynthesis protein [Lentisphaeria bacterium]